VTHRHNSALCPTAGSLNAKGETRRLPAAAEVVNHARDPSPTRSAVRPAATDARAYWVVFRIDDERFALPLAAVERVVRAAEITPLPHAPDVVLGAIDIAGEILPVFDLRRRFALPARALHPDQQLLIAHTAQRRVVLLIDAALDVHERADDQIVTTKQLAPDAPMKGFMALEDGLVLIHDLEHLLTHEESGALETALRAKQPPHAR
jgi:purine-binding chemotaxis protein CheW